MLLALPERYADARLFIVDDNPTNVALLRAILTRAGYRNLFSETDSRQVLSRFAEVDPDLIILDLHMPFLDGYAVLDQIRQIAEQDTLPVLVLTADTTPAASERALNSGAQDFVTKPFSNGEVLVRTRNLLRMRFAFTTLRSSLLRQQEANRQSRQLSRALSAEQHATEELRLLDGLKSTLLQTVSHDLRSPISAVLMMTTVLAADAAGQQPLTPDVRSAIIEKVEQSAIRMDRLLKDILDSDPMRSLSGEQRVCDVGGVVQRVLGEVDLRADHPVHVQVSPVAALVDPAHLERIVENLLSNAQQHVPQGIPIWVNVDADGDDVLIVVEDGGTGIDAGHRRRDLRAVPPGRAGHSGRARPGSVTGLPVRAVARRAGLGRRSGRRGCVIPGDAAPGSPAGFPGTASIGSRQRTGERLTIRPITCRV